MTIGEFSRRTRLSAKALRLYDRLGLVVPAGVDEINGYRYYSEEQVADAVLVGTLRRLDMPLSTIAAVLDAGSGARAALVRRYWDGVEEAVAERRKILAYVLSRLQDATAAIHRVEVRVMPERRIASVSRHVSIGATDGFFHAAFARLRSLGPPLEGIAGCPFLVFYGEVSDDSDGPMELCRPLAGPLPADIDGVEIRTEAAHDEAWVRLTREELAWPTMRAALDELEAWAVVNDREPAATFRQVLIADQRQAAADTLVCDLSVPLR